MADRHLAQLNIGRLRYETSDPRMADFVDNLARVNAIADRTQGFVWRLQDGSGNATDYRPYPDDPRMAINMSVWATVEAFETYVWQTVQAVLRPPRGMVREARRPLLRDVVGAGRPHPDGAGGDPAARVPTPARPKRPRLRLGKPAGGTALENGAMRMTDRARMA